MATYSFIDVGAAIDGPGGNISIGYGAGVAEEGITIERVEDMNTMTKGADGSTMHSLHSSSASTVRLRLLKTSPTNAKLQDMLNFQRLSGANHGRNVIRVQDHLRGDIVTCTVVAFTGPPSLTWGKQGAMNEWVFHAGNTDPILGIGLPADQAAA
jgi:hypothetical protein